MQKFAGKSGFLGSEIALEHKINRLYYLNGIWFSFIDSTSWSLVCSFSILMRCLQETEKSKNPWTFLLYLTNQGQVIFGNTTNWLNQICSNTETLKEGELQSFNMVPRWRSKWNLIGRAAIFNGIQLNIQDFILAYFIGKSKNMDSFTFYLLSVVLVLTLFVATPTTGKEQLYHSFENVKL